MKNMKISTILSLVIIMSFNIYNGKAQYVTYIDEYLSVAPLDTSKIVNPPTTFYERRKILKLGEKWYMGCYENGLDIGCYNHLGVPQGYKIFIQPPFVGILNKKPLYKLDVSENIMSTTNYTQSSDIRLKDNINDLTNCLDKLILINGKIYNKNKSISSEYGIIAQELLEIYPNLVSKDAEGYLSVNYSGLLAIIIETIKEQNLILEQQEEEINKLLKKK